jgi:hypothetical protein
MVVLKLNRKPKMATPPGTIKSLLLCPTCSREMRLFGIEPEGEKRDLYTFECEHCDRVEVRGVRIK